MMSKFRPLEGFSTELIPLLLRSAITPTTIFAEEDAAPPRLVKPSESHDLSRTIRTRWHTLEFSRPQAAVRFRALQHLSHELHELRRSMKHFDHPNAADVYRVKVSVDDYTGSLKIRSHDAALADLLATAQPGETTPQAPMVPA